MPFFGIGMKTDLFQSCGHCWVFQVSWHIVCSTFTASSFRIWNRSTGIPSPPLALLVVMLPKAHFPSDSRLSGSRWVILPPLLNISCFCCVHTISVLYWAHLCMKCPLGIFNFLEEISSLSHSIVSLYFFALTTEEGFLISPCYSLELCVQMGISFLFSFPFGFSSFHSICKASLDSHFAFLHFFFLGMVLIPVSYTMSQTSVHSSSGTVSDLVT